jgi:hypothetical protein
MMKKEVKYIIYYYKFNSSALLRRYHCIKAEETKIYKTVFNLQGLYSILRSSL